MNGFASVRPSDLSFPPMPPPRLRLTVAIPARNEAATLPEIIRRVRATGRADQIIVVDDGSTDETSAVLAGLSAEGAPLIVLTHAHNRGKGAALRTALGAARGELFLVQDADLEYDPGDYPALLAPFAHEATRVVYGSRNLRPNARSSAVYYWGGRLLSWIASGLYRARVTDEATGYKVFRTALLRDLRIDSDGFAFCAEITGKLLHRGIAIVEVPITYQPRTRAAGKKIHWFDGAIAIAVLVRERLARRNCSRRR
jgi:glycosyltransferase involved in cell wall biosynthesis